MKAGFLTAEQVFGHRGITLFSRAEHTARVTDFARVLSDDDGFFADSDGSVNWFLADGRAVSRFGKDERCELCAVRPAILL